jgi:4'-phosphopantetheinyl transferase
MIHWLLNSIADIPALVQANPPLDWLCEAERLRLDGLRVEKRRRDWMLGRWTAKQLLQAYCQQAHGFRPPLEALIVGRVQDTGAPVAALAPRHRPEGVLPEASVSLIPLVGRAGHQVSQPLPVVAAVPLPVSISISHSECRAFCALVARSAQSVAVGADVEQVDVRPAGLVAGFFSTAEAQWIAQVPASWRDVIITSTWSAKEAVLKALRLGLTVDTRRVSCLCQLGDGGAGSKTGWLPVHVDCDPELLTSFDAGALAGNRDLRARSWWRLEEGFVLTLAILQRDDH